MAGDSSATSFVALASLVLTELQAIETALSNLSGHTHGAGLLLDSTGNPCTGTTGAGPSNTYSASSVACTKLKAK